MDDLLDAADEKILEHLGGKLHGLTWLLLGPKICDLLNNFDVKVFIDRLLFGIVQIYEHVR